jgi:hypothetical protein
MEQWCHKRLDLMQESCFIGRKRHFLVDTLGLVLMVVVTSAYESDKAGAKKLFVQANKRISDCPRGSALRAIA